MSRHRRQHKYDVTLASEQAEAVVLIAAHTRDEAARRALTRALYGEVSWEGEPGHQYEVTSVVDLGIDEGG